MGFLNINFDFLKNHPDLIERCATWSFSQWGINTPEKTLQDYIDSRKEYALNDQKLPLTVIAFVDKVPVGMCSIVSTRDVVPELSPWLTGLYVEASYRNKGIGKLLEQQICSIAKKIGFSKIYCFTSDILVVPWYRKHSWVELKKGRVHNHDVTVMVKQIQ